MSTFNILLRFLPLLALFATSYAATAAEWRSRSIYQYVTFSTPLSLADVCRIVTDRFALPDGSNGACDEGIGRYCGGSWRGIINKLDYIQGMGFDAIWISPVSANIEGSFRWGEAYHVSHPSLIQRYVMMG
jgi:alpha-amylase